ncbi:MAG TPA: hypothetical protein DDY49_00310 [Paenibacillaceae bacterium]|nr:hypothetical protein [Paenibacillaceae bacterium]
MFIRIYLNTDNQQDALNILENVLNQLDVEIQNKEIVKVEPYWKMEEVYIIEVSFLVNKLTEEGFEKFLEKISDKWTYFDHPINEVLASETTDGCTFLFPGVKLINIHL